MNKSFRQGQILKLIQSERIATQDELARKLAERGIQTTQVTLSRDLRELGLVKSTDGYRRLESSPPGPDFATVAAEFLTDVRVAQNLVVLKTLPANAATVAAALDREGWPEVVGTVAGDDTILVIASDHATALLIRERLETFV